MDNASSVRTSPAKLYQCDISALEREGPFSLDSMMALLLHANSSSNSGTIAFINP